MTFDDNDPRAIYVRGILNEQVFVIPAPPGKVVLLLGHNGAGKSRALEATRALTSGRGEVSVFDGVDRGEVCGFDTVLRVGRRTTRTGRKLDELAVTSIEGRFDVSTLVNPGIDKPEAAEAARIKALVQLAGGPGADAALFYQLAGGQEQFTHYVSPASLETDDLVTMAMRIKRDFEKHARAATDEAEKEIAAAAAARQLTEGIDMTVPDDGDALQADLELAIREDQRLKSEAGLANQALLMAQTARRNLAGAEANYQGPTLEQAIAQKDSAQTELQKANATVAQLEQQLRDARDVAQQATTRHQSAANQLQIVQSHFDTLANWRATVQQAEHVQPVAPELLEAAASDVLTARTALEQGAVVRRAKQHNTDAANHMAKAAEWRTISDSLRDAGKGTDDVLSDVVQKLGCPLRVSAGRLVTDTTRGETPFAELSDGERWKIALDIAIDAVGPNGVITIEQNAWQDLDPNNRQLIIDRVAQTDCTLFTAQCDDGDLRAEVL